MTSAWIEMLESWWVKGKGRYNTIAKQLLITTLLSVSTQTIANITRELGISNIDTLSLYPLLGCVLLNDNLSKRIPDLKSKLGFLNLIPISTDASIETHMIDKVEPDGEGHFGDVTINENDVTSLTELFPQFSRYQLTELLKRYDSNVELITNTLFENPSVIDDIPKEPKTSHDANDNLGKQILKSKPSPVKSNIKNIEPELVLHREMMKTKKQAIEQITKRHVPDEVRNKTLTRALKLLYENDEDERDDTYDEAEVKRSNTPIKIALGDDDGDSEQDASKEKNRNNYDAIEGYLWNLLKEDKSLFERNKRGSKVRKDMKAQINWSDEQIEGWARMLERSPQRARILEEKFMFRGNKRSGKTSYVKNRDGDSPVINDDRRRNQHQNPSRPKNKKNNTKKKGIDDAKKTNEATKSVAKGEPASTESTEPTETAKNKKPNEKKKASRSSHNRKSGFR